MLLLKFAKVLGKENVRQGFYGQEVNITTYNFAESICFCIMVITDRSDRYGRKLVKKIKEYFSKEQHQVVTSEEFCQFMGLQTEAVAKQLR